MKLLDRCPRALARAGALSVSSLVALACAHDQRPPAARPERASPVAVSEPAPAPPPMVAYLAISESLRQKCGVPDSASDSAQFDFKAANLLPRGMGILDQIADCMRRGSLHGPGLTIIGNPDPHGPDAYNRVLGMERASAAEDYLIRHGVARSSLEVRALGQQDVRGESTPDRALDRRILIEERTAPP